MLPRGALSRVTLVGLLAAVSLYAPQHSTATSTVARTTQLGSLAAPRLAPYRPVTTSLDMEFRGTALDAVWVEVASRSGTFLVPVKNRRFEAAVSLVPNAQNRIAFAAIAQSGARSSLTMARVTHDTERPFVAVDHPTRDIDLSDVATVDVSGRVGDRLSGELGITVEVNGVAAQVRSGMGIQGTFYAKSVPVATSGPAIRVIATDRLGNVEEQTVSPGTIVTKPDVTTPGTDAFGRISVVSGNGQTATANTALPNPIVVQVDDLAGVPIVNKLVTFRVVRSNGILNGNPLVFQIFTDAMGQAQASWTLGTSAGFGNNIVVAKSTGILGFAVFSASATPAPPSQINVSAGNQQSVALGGAAPLPLRARLSDACNGVGMFPVTFTVVSGDGTVDGATQVTKLTDSNGLVEVAFVVGTTVGNNDVEADFTGNPGLPAVFTVQGIAANEPTTSLTGLVIDNSLQPIAGATATVETLFGVLIDTTTTDANGFFTFPDLAFAGLGVLRVDGSTGGNFPEQRYAVEIIQFAQNSLAGPIKLPRLDPANIVPYDGTTAVTLTVARIEGFALHVAANTTVTLLGGTVVGPNDPGSVDLQLNQVHHDDVPVSLTDGASPPFAWSLEPAGATFDPPLAITYPNMAGLLPGSISTFRIFDNDTGEFLPVGTGQVDPDGALIQSDAGVGMTTAGLGVNTPPFGITSRLDFCGRECVDSGTLTFTGTSDVTVSQEVVCATSGTLVTFTAPGAADSGGMVQENCPDGSSTAITLDPVAPSYEFTVDRDGTTLLTGMGPSVAFSPTVQGVYTATFTIGADRECPPTELQTSGQVTAVDFMLTRVGTTVIEAGNNYSENATFSFTVMPDPGVVLRARFREVPGTSYYDGADGATDLTMTPTNTVTLTGGQAQLVIRSVSNAPVVAGPVDALIEVDLLDALDSLICTSTAVAVDQWVDEDSDGFIDWLQQHSNDILTCAQGQPGEVGAVTGEVTGISQGGAACGQTMVGSTLIEISPTCNIVSPNPHRLNAGQELTITVLHESRHAWVNHELTRNDIGVDDDANPGTPSNDDDGDRWAEILGGFLSADDIIELTSPSMDDGTPDPDPTFTLQEVDAEDFGQTNQAICP